MLFLNFQNWSLFVLNSLSSISLVTAQFLHSTVFRLLWNYILTMQRALFRQISKILSYFFYSNTHIHPYIKYTFTISVFHTLVIIQQKVCVFIAWFCSMDRIWCAYNIIFILSRIQLKLYDEICIWMLLFGILTTLGSTIEHSALRFYSVHNISNTVPFIHWPETKKCLSIQWTFKIQQHQQSEQNLTKRLVNVLIWKHYHVQSESISYFNCKVIDVVVSVELSCCGQFSSVQCWWSHARLAQH